MEYKNCFISHIHRTRPFLIKSGMKSTAKYFNNNNVSGACRAVHSFIRALHFNNIPTTDPRSFDAQNSVSNDLHC